MLFDQNIPRLLRLATLAAVSLAPPAAFATVTVPPAIYSQSLAVQAGKVHTKLSHTYGSFTISGTGTGASASTSSAIKRLPAPSLSAGVTASATTYAGGGSVNQMQYAFQVIGPATVSVPILVTGTGSLSVTLPTDNASASLTAFPNQGSETSLAYACPAGGTSGGCGAFNAPLSITVTSSTSTTQAAANTIQLQTSASTAVPYNTIDSATVAASLSAKISIAPSFPHASLYHIKVSPGVGN